MKQTIEILLENRFNDVEKITNLLSGAGFQVKKMFLSDGHLDDLSKFVVVIEAGDKNVKNLMIRLEQLIRVKSVVSVEGDHFPSVEEKFEEIN